MSSLLGVAVAAREMTTMGIAAGEPKSPTRIVAIGDSLTAGYGLPPRRGFPFRLEAALVAKGHDVRIVDAGLSGDTASGGLARLAWVLSQPFDGAIVELGGNDALRGLDPALTRRSLDAILREMKKRGIDVLLAGMRAPRNLGEAFTSAFDAIHPDLAREHDVLLYPFFLDGVALDPQLNLLDGIHPNEAGVEVIVSRIMPSVERLLDRVRARRR